MTKKRNFVKRMKRFKKKRKLEKRKESIKQKKQLCSLTVNQKLSQSSDYFQGHLYKGKSPSSQRANSKRLHQNCYVSLSESKKNDQKIVNIRKLSNVKRQRNNVNNIHTVFRKYNKFPEESTRTYFSGTNTYPKGLPEKNASWVPVNSLEIVDMQTLNVPSLIVKSEGKEGKKFIVGCVDNLKSANIFNNQNTVKALDYVIEKLGKRKNARSAKRQPCSRDKVTAYFTGGPTCLYNSKGIIDNSKDIELPYHRKEVHRLIKEGELASRHVIDPDFRHAHKCMMEYFDVPGYKETNGSQEQTRIYSNLAVGKNVYLPIHQDQDTFLSTTIVFDSMNTRIDNQILCFFCFPDYRVAIPMRHSEIIVFDPWVRHCISSPSVDQDIMCMSLYTKDKLVGGNDNSKQLDETLVGIAKNVQ